MKTGTARRPMLVFTDGAVEPEEGTTAVTIGGVLFDPEASGPPEYFAAKVLDAKVGEWLACGSRHPVFQAEVLPVLVAAATWGEGFRIARPSFSSTTKPHGLLWSRVTLQCSLQRLW